MRDRKKLIQKELAYLDYLHAQIANQANQTHFRAAVEWRQSQAESYRSKYYFFRWMQAFIGILIIALGAFQDGFIGISISILGGLSTFVSLILSLHKYHENWRRYRNSLEQIKSLTRVYNSHNMPFHNSDQYENDKRYVMELDRIIDDETKGWKSMRDQDEVEYAPRKS